MVLINNTGSSARAWLPKVIGLWLMIACLLTSETVGSGCRVLYLRMMIFWPLHYTHNSSPANGGLNCAFFCAGFPLICGFIVLFCACCDRYHSCYGKTAIYGAAIEEAMGGPLAKSRWGISLCLSRSRCLFFLSTESGDW